MSTRLIRRFQRNSQGQLEEVGLVEDPVTAGDEDRTTEAEVMPDGTLVPLYKAFVPRLAPPRPSAPYRADPRYTTRMDIIPATRTKAHVNYRAWTNLHDEATNRMSAWLGAQGLLGPELEAAYKADGRADQAATRARQTVAAAQLAEVQAEQNLAEAVATWSETGNGPMPTAARLLAARANLEAVEVAAEAVEQAGRQARLRLGQARGRIDWAAALARTEKLDTPDAKAATAWLRAKVHPPVGPNEDPLRWI